MPDTETYTPAQLADETQTLAENFVGAALEIEDTREGIAQVQETVDEINAKITPQNLQVKTVTPSNIQRTIQADVNLGYTALSGVIVEPISALMPSTVEDYITRNDRATYFSLNINGDIPAYACYCQLYLRAVYGRIGSIGDNAFYGCTSLENIDGTYVYRMGSNVFYNAGLENLDIRNISSLHSPSFTNSNIISIDARGLTTAGIFAFKNSSKLKFLDIRNINSIGTNCFENCSNLKLIDFTAKTTPPTLNSGAFQNAGNFWAVFKDDSIKAEVQAATNWSAIASRIYTVAEIEALVGMTYDEYYLQIFGHARNEVTE